MARTVGHCNDILGRCGGIGVRVLFEKGARIQDQPPAPTNPDVYIEDRPELHVFSRRFHGFAHDEDWIVNAAMLHDDLLAAGLDAGINFHNYYTVVYDSPFTIVDRNNEVWFVQEGTH